MKPDPNNPEFSNCEHCGRSYDEPLTVCPSDDCPMFEGKPNPIIYGEMLADYIQEQTLANHEDLKSIGVFDEQDNLQEEAVYNTIRLMWERNFWREKVLGK